MKSHLVLRIALSALILVALSFSASAAILDEARSAGMISVNTSIRDSATRVASYKAALETIFPEIETDSLKLVIERTNDYGSIVQFRQYEHGIKILKSNAWLSVTKDDEVTFSGVKWFDSGLSYQSFLEDKDDLPTLMSLAASYCAHCDSISNVTPCIYPYTDSLGLDTAFAYALIVYSPDEPSGIIFDWATGDSITSLGQWHVLVNLDAKVMKKNHTETDQADEVAMAHLGFLGVTWLGAYQDPHYTGDNGVAQVDVHTDENDDWQYQMQYNALSLYMRTHGDPDYLYQSGGQLDPPVPFQHYPLVPQDVSAGTSCWYLDQAQFWSTSLWILADFSSDNFEPYTIYGEAPGPDHRVRPEIHFGELNDRPYAQYRDVIDHEYGHALQLEAYGETGIDIGYRVEGWSLAEGLANFFAAHMGTIDGADGTEVLLFPGATPNDPLEFDIAPGLGYETYPWPNFNSEVGGQIYSSALWAFREAVEAGYGLTGVREIFQKFIFAHTFEASDFASWTNALAIMLDNNGNLCDGWPYGQEMYEAFWVEHHIPCKPAWNSPVDNWTYYRTEVLPTETIESTTTFALGSSETTNLVKGQRGLYAVYEDGSDKVVLAWSRDDGATWRRKVLDQMSGVQINPSVAINENGGSDELFIAFQGPLSGGPTINALLLSIDGAQNCDVSLLAGLILYPSGLDQGPFLSDPVCVFSDGEPTLFVGVSNSDQDDGLKYWRMDHSLDNIDFGYIGGSNGVDVSHVAAFASQGSNIVQVAWAQGDAVYYRHGQVNGGTGDIDWNAARVTIDQTTAHVPRNISVAYSEDIQGAFVAWEDDNAESNSRIRVRHGYWDEVADHNPDFEATRTFTYGSTGDFSHPVLSPYAVDNTDLPANTPRMALAYVSSNADVSNVVLFTSLWINEGSPTDDSQWNWLPPLHVVGSAMDRTSSPSLYTANAEGGYALLTLSTNSSPYPIKFWRAERPYGNDMHIVWPDISISSIDTIITPFAYGGSIVVEDGGSLVIKTPSGATGADTKFALWDSCGIAVEQGGALKIFGESGEPLTMSAVDSISTVWNGIYVHKGTLDLDYVEMTDCETVGLYTDNAASVYISNCTFTGNKMLGNRGTVRLTNGPSVTQNMDNCTITAEAAEGYGLYAYNCKVKLTDLRVENCAKLNSAFSVVTGDVSNCTFKDRTDKYGVLFFSAGTTPNFTCCTFENVAPTNGSPNATIHATLGTAPTFGFEGNTGEFGNTFKDNSAYMLRMQGNGVLPVIDNPSSSGAGGKNNWYQYKSDGKYLYWVAPYSNPLNQYSAKEQYWNKEPVDIKDFEPANTSYFGLGTGESEPWDQCGGGAASNDPDGGRAISTLDDLPSVYDTLFAEAVSLEAAEEYQEAQNIFRMIATNADDYRLVWQATTHVVSTQRALDAEAGEVWIPSLIDSLILADSSAYSTFVYGNRLLSTYRLAREEYSEAITICSDLLNGELTDVDSILVSIDLLGIQMAAGLVEYGGGLDEAGYSSIPQPLRCSSMANAVDKQAALLDALSELDSEEHPTSHSSIPTEFRLYQNYPNPFNPTTQIEFDLPEGARVELRVFNTLGQEVAMVKDAMLPAGHHVVTWNGKSSTGADVATGLYIYQIKAGSFTDTKKMVLMR